MNKKLYKLYADDTNEKFWSFVIIPEDDKWTEKCWEYTKITVDSKGKIKAQFCCDGGKVFTAAKYIYGLCFLNKTLPPKELHALHKCDNRKCVNPTHIYLGTNQDNINDRINRGRSTIGIKHPNVFLTEDQVLEIKRRLENGRRGINLELAKEFNVKPGTICDIKKNRKWKHLQLSQIN